MSHADPGGSERATQEPLAPYSARGRSFTGHRKVRLGDVDRDGRLRLDALTRYTQDVSDDDTTDAGLDPVPGWVVRTTVVDEVIPARLAERLTFCTFCSGLGKRWAERRLTVRGDHGAHYEVATLWVCIDVEAGRPHLLTDRFIELYGEAADGRSVSARLINPKMGEFDARDLTTDRWQLRVADYDVYDHVNNAAYWALVEQWTQPDPSTPRRIRLEYGQGLAPADAVMVSRARRGTDTILWWLEGETGPGAAACASITALQPDLYAPAD